VIFFSPRDDVSCTVNAVGTAICGVKRKELKSSQKNTGENNAREEYIRLVII